MSRSTHFLPNWKTIIAYLRDEASDWKPKALFVAALVYLIWPIDFLPDFAPLIGWLDDLGGASLATFYILHAAKRYEDTHKRLTSSDSASNS